MPEYLAPGVYIEETSYRAKSIEGVSTSTAGFVGPTRSGPSVGKPEVLTSFADFQRTYGDQRISPLARTMSPMQPVHSSKKVAPVFTLCA